MKMKNFLSESFFRESVYILKWKLLKTRTDEKIICPFLGKHHRPESPKKKMS